MPDYEIKQWDESNWDVRCCDYVSEAYDARMWAFVSDYARFDILYHFGGVYFDTDVELIRPIDDILSQGPFLGFEKNCFEGNRSSMDVAGYPVANPGLGMFAVPGMDFYKKLLRSYEDGHFANSDGSFDKTTVVIRVTRELIKDGLKKGDGVQCVDGIRLYPSDFFNPKDFITGRVTTSNNTRSIHHFSMSWYSPVRKYKHELGSKMISRGVPKTIARLLSILVAVCKYRRIQ